jgi:hypothetical protein
MRPLSTCDIPELELDTSVTIELRSVLTCPECGHFQEEVMPENACVRFYDCTQCGQLLSPYEGDCCVLCSFGSVPCPPIQGSNANFS